MTSRRTFHSNPYQTRLQHYYCLFKMLKALLGYLPWWDCMLMVGERNFPECRAAAGWPAPKWPGDGGILPGAAEAPSRCDSIAASPESSGGGTCTDLGGPKSRPSIIHPRAIKKGKKKRQEKKICSDRQFRKSFIRIIIMSLDFQANPRPYPALCRPTKKTNKGSLDEHKLIK